MDYNARFYSPYLNRWIQPDTIVPSLSNPQSLNRYTYVNNNPLRYTDPGGHKSCDGPLGDRCLDAEDDLRPVDELLEDYGVSAEGITGDKLLALYYGIYRTAKKLQSETEEQYESPEDAFKAVFHTDTEPLVIAMNPRCYGCRPTSYYTNGADNWKGDCKPAYGYATHQHVGWKNLIRAKLLIVQHLFCKMIKFLSERSTRSIIL